MKILLSLLAFATPLVWGQPDFFGILSNEEQGQGHFRCGASLIHEDVMITSSFCTQVGDIVRIGYKNDTNATAIRTVIRYITHPDAGGPQENFPNDVEVFKLSAPVTEITPVKINSNTAEPPSNGVTVYYAHAGAIPDFRPGNFSLGEAPLSRTFSTELITGTATTDNFALCRKSYADLDPEYESKLEQAIQFCAKTNNIEIGPCDSGAWGSPLWMMVDGEPVLAGTASQGPCSEGLPPYIWTRTAFYASWIQSQICELSPNTGCTNSKGK